VEGGAEAGVHVHHGTLRADRHRRDQQPLDHLVRRLAEQESGP
jgi:hypothetical protein